MNFSVASFILLFGMSLNLWANPSLSKSPLTFNGLGPIQLGMSQKQLTQLGFDFSDEPSGYDECVELNLHADSKLSVMLENDRVTRITLNDALILTNDGTKIGDTEQDIKKVYGNRVEIKPHQYDENGHYLVVMSSDKKYAIVYETDGSRVDAIHAGLAESAQYVEGCL